MQVNSTNAATSAPSSQTASSSSAASVAATVNYNQFLQLLIAEMKNQDPTQPMDPTQSIAQLASFSQVEQQLQTNSKLDTLLTSSALTQADAVIGRTLTTADGQTSGQVVAVTVSSSGTTATLGDGTQVPIVNGVTIS
jgi:flagellar basal-body rod modification protein FlgD